MKRSQYYRQAPVGNRSYVDVFSQQPRAGFRDMGGWNVHWLGTGTMCIAAALLAGTSIQTASGPKVLVPAYSCPDLVSSVRFAGAEPLYVDLLPDSSRMDLDQARQLASSETHVAAIIGVDLFGIPEDWAGIRSLADELGLFVIQDMAQSLQLPELLEGELVGDAVVFSFGRGKPVCCFGGGALLTRSEEGDRIGQSIEALRGHWVTTSNAFGRTKALFYNQVLRPPIYAQFAKLMGNRLGETRYKPLPDLAFLSRESASAIDRAVTTYWREHRDRYEQVVQAVDDVIDQIGTDRLIRLPDGWESNQERRMSRLPILVRDSLRRNEIVAQCIDGGVTATTMYSRTLPLIVAEFDGVENRIDTPCAQNFADMLMTVPVHERITDRDIEVVANALQLAGAAS